MAVLTVLSVPATSAIRRRNKQIARIGHMRAPDEARYSRARAGRVSQQLRAQRRLLAQRGNSAQSQSGQSAQIGSQARHGALQRPGGYKENFDVWNGPSMPAGRSPQVEPPMPELPSLQEFRRSRTSSGNSANGVGRGSIPSMRGRSQEPHPPGGIPAHRTRSTGTSSAGIGLAPFRASPLPVPPSNEVFRSAGAANSAPVIVAFPLPGNRIPGKGSPGSPKADNGDPSERP